MAVPFTQTPSMLMLIGIGIFALAYWGYSKWVDRKVWQVDPARPTPAHMYTDGVEFFPVGRYVLYGFQFNSVAALGPIVGPAIALAFGWLPAFLWIVGAGLFIGWVQDYSAMTLSMRNEGKSFGPLAYELVGPGSRKLLLSYLLFYFILINAAFMFVLGVFFDAFPGVFWATIVLMIASFITGHLIFKVRMNIITVTIIAIALMTFGIVFGTLFQWPAKGALGAAPYTGWLVVVIAILFLGTILPLPKLVTPMNYIAYYPIIVAIALIVVGGALSPLTGIKLEQPAMTSFWTKAGPLWPILFVSIACGAISGWHSLVSTGITSRQVDVETDARPVGAGAMLTENIVGLTALVAYMVVTPKELAPGWVPNFVGGATKLSAPLFGGAIASGYFRTFFAIYIVFMGITLLTIVGRYWRVVSGEIFGGTKLSFLGNKYLSSVLAFAIPTAFVLTGSWINIWLYFGGTNQLLAGFALMIIAIYLIRERRFHWYSFIPGVFMMVTTLAALVWQAFYVFLPAVTGNKPFPEQGPLVKLGGTQAALALNLFSVIIGVIMLVIGATLFYMLLKAAARHSKQPAVVKA